MVASNETKESEFHIGLTMAGAVSAGCYTAGVMDYLFEILELWEQAKEGKLPQGWNSEMLDLIPQHKVIIDAMGGASAGGMTTIMSAIYAMKGKINPVSNPENKSSKKDNVLYDSWVLMGDNENENVKLFEKTLALDDLENNTIPSLLNSKFIDVICDGAFIDDVGNTKKLPSYVSQELEILLPQTMLRSVPLSIDFSTPFGTIRKKNDSPKHITFEHFIISHFKLDYDVTNPKHKDFYLPLDPFVNEKSVATLKLATKATGAFPIGLSYREFFNNEFSDTYIKNNARKLIFNKMEPESIPIDPNFEWNDLPNPFNFIGVDGGAINNEPFGEVLNILKERHGEKSINDYDKFALLMIDPFPDNSLYNNYQQPTDIFSAVPAIIGTLQEQSKVKRKEMLALYDNTYFRGEIYPVRYFKNEVTNKFEKEDDAIACGSAFAFGGFLDINFRHHDFFLGRDNARNFFKVYFSFEYDPTNNNVHPIHRSWTPEMVNNFKFTRENKVFLPIIPNLYELKDKLDKVNRNPYKRTVEEWPLYNPDQLFALAPKMEERIKKMLELSLSKFGSPSDDTKHPVTDKWIEKYYHQGLFKRVTSWLGSKFLGALITTNKGNIASKGAKATICWILKDLEDKKLIR